MQTRAAVLEATGLPAPYAQSRPLQIRTVELDPPGPGEVLVRILAAGLCHSDLSVITGERPRPVPMAIGHESCGEIVTCGAGVDDLKAGDRVVLVFMPSCGGCVPCMEGRPALCEPGAEANARGTLLGGHRRIHDAGRSVNHHLGVSCFGDYAVVSRRSCVRVPDDLDPAEASLFGCAVLTGVGAVVNTARVQAGTRVAVIGLGGVGFAALLAAVASGALDVVAVDLSDDKLAFAKSLGATHAFSARDPDVAAHVRAATHGGVDHAIEAAGAVPALELAWHVTRRGGTTVTVGLPPPERRLAVPPVQLVAEERTLRGSYIGSAVPVRDIPRYVALFRAGRLPVDRLMGERLTLDDVNRGFDRLAGGQAMRDVIVM